MHEDVEQRTGENQEKRQNAEQMCAVFRRKEERGDQQEACCRDDGAEA
jgi:hypothetical protein